MRLLREAFLLCQCAGGIQKRKGEEQESESESEKETKGTGKSGIRRE